MSRTAPTAPPNRRDVRPYSRPATPPVWFADQLLSVLVGTQPVIELAGRVSPDVYDRLWHMASVRPAWSQSCHVRRPTVRRYRVMPVSAGVLEVTAVVTLSPDITRAIAFRLERGSTQFSPRSPQAWRCTAVDAR